MMNKIVRFMLVVIFIVVIGLATYLGLWVVGGGG